MSSGCRLFELLLFLLLSPQPSPDASLVLFDALALFEPLTVVLCALQNDDSDEGNGQDGVAGCNLSERGEECVSRVDGTCPDG